MIIAVEGIDGAGKNTLVTAVARLCNAEVLGFPRYETSPQGKLLREALYGRMGDLTDSIYGMAVLFALDREGARDLIEPYTDGGARADEVLIIDRYVASNAAYAAARAEDRSLINFVGELEFEQLGVPVPDVQILLGTSAEVARVRAEKRAHQDASRALDAFEKDRSLQDRTFDNYLHLAETDWYSPWEIVSSDDDPQVAAQKLFDTHIASRIA